MLLDDPVGQDGDPAALECVEHANLDSAFSAPQLEETLTQGGGVRATQAVPLLREQVEECQASVVGRDVVPAQSVQKPDELRCCVAPTPVGHEIHEGSIS